MKKASLLITFSLISLISVFAQNPTVGIWYSTWYSNYGKYIWTESHGVGSSNQFLGDMNGDGKDDAIVYFSGTGSWNVALSDGISYSGYFV